MPDIVGRLRPPRLSAAPASPSPGEVYYDTGANKLYWWNGSTWVDTSGGGSAWVSVLSAQPVLDNGIWQNLRAGKGRLSLSDFVTTLGLKAPAGLWFLNSSMNDSSGNNRSLTNKGGVGFTTNHDGAGNSAAQFTGSAAQVLYRNDTGSSDPFRIFGGSWGCWFRTAKRGSWQALMGKYSTAAGQRMYWTQIVPANVIITEISHDGTASSTGAYGTTDVCDDRWHFVVVTFDGAMQRIYVDGLLEGTSAYTNWIFYGSAPFNIGGVGADNSNTTINPFFGAIDDVFVTNDLLTDDQVRFLYSSKTNHGLGKAPTTASVNVRRLRKGGALAVGDFPTPPLRLHNLTNGSSADQGSNAVPLTNPAITRLGAFTPFMAGIVAPPGNPAQLTVPAAGIPAGSTILVFGCVAANYPATITAVTDTRNNVWTKRGSETLGVFVLECQVTTALVSGDLIRVTWSTTASMWGMGGIWCSKCSFDTMAQGTYAGTAADGGAITTAPGGGLVLGVFGVPNASPSPVPSLSAVGAGYTNETGATTVSPGEGSGGWDWMSKNGTGGVVEDATGTFTTAGSARYGATIAYTAAPPPLSAGADGSQNGAVAFNGSVSLGSTDAGLPSGTAARSYGCWLKLPASLVTSGNYVAIGWGTTSTADARLIAGYPSVGQIGCISGSDAVSGGVAIDGQWHFAVCTEDNAAADGVKRKLYLDGKVVAGSTVLNPITLGGATSFRVGANSQGGGSPFTGQIDSVFVCDYALTGPQIAQLYAKGSEALATSSKDSGSHIEGMDGGTIYTIFDPLESQHQVDLAVS